ncbi:MAG: hypothetical protein ACMG6S_30510, partial [Byssovorax sp.]
MSPELQPSAEIPDFPEGSPLEDAVAPALEEPLVAAVRDELPVSRALERADTSDARDALERRLTREILIAERLRSTLLAIVPGAAMLVFLAGSALEPTLLVTIFRGPVDRVPVGFFLGVVAVYEFYSLYSIERLIRSQKKPPALRRYV